MTIISQKVAGDRIGSAEMNALLNKVQNGTDFDLNIARVIYPTGFTGTRLQNALNALATNRGGIVQLSAGTYTTSTALTTPTTTDWIQVRGMGMGATKILPNTNMNWLLSFRSNGGVCDMTLDGNNQAGNVLEGINALGSGLTITRQDFERLHIKNSRTTIGGWVFVVWDVNETYTLKTVRINDVILEGPSSTSQDAFAVAAVDSCFVKNLHMKDLYRTPNFFSIHRLVMDGCYIENIVNSGGLVIDNNVLHADVSNLVVDAASEGVGINCPEINITNSTILTYLQTTVFGAVVRSNIRLSNSRLNRFVVTIPPGKIVINGCYFVPSTVGPISDTMTAASVWPNAVITNNIFNNNAASRWLTSFNGTTWSSFVIQDNVIVGPNNGILNVTFSNSILRRNVGYATENGGDASVSNGTTIAHGLVTTPTKVVLTSQSALPRIMSITAKGATTFTIGVLSTTGTAVSNTRAYWYAEV